MSGSIPSIYYKKLKDKFVHNLFLLGIIYFQSFSSQKHSLFFPPPPSPKEKTRNDSIFSNSTDRWEFDLLNSAIEFHLNLREISHPLIILIPAQMEHVLALIPVYSNSLKTMITPYWCCSLSIDITICRQRICLDLPTMTSILTNCSFSREWSLLQAIGTYRKWW